MWIELVNINLYMWACLCTLSIQMPFNLTKTYWRLRLHGLQDDGGVLVRDGCVPSQRSEPQRVATERRASQVVRDGCFEKWKKILIELFFPLHWNKTNFISLLSCYTLSCMYLCSLLMRSQSTALEVDCMWAIRITINARGNTIAKAGVWLAEMAEEVARNAMIDKRAWNK